MAEKAKKLKDYEPILVPDDYTPKHMCLNVRGTNGSGKTFLMNRFLKEDAKEILVNGWPVQDCGEYYVLGRYNNVCGGLDGIKDFYAITPIVNELIESKHVLMEGLLWSGIFGASYELNRDLIKYGHGMAFLMLDTPSDRCVDNVVKRRLDRLDDRPLNTSALIAKYRSCVRISEAAIRICPHAFIGDVDYLEGVMRSFLAGEPFGPGERDPFARLQPHDENIPDVVDWHVERIKAIKAEKQEQTSLFNMFG